MQTGGRWMRSAVIGSLSASLRPHVLQCLRSILCFGAQPPAYAPTMTLARSMPAMPNPITAVLEVRMRCQLILGKRPPSLDNRRFKPAQCCISTVLWTGSAWAHLLQPRTMFHYDP